MVSCGVTMLPRRAWTWDKPLRILVGRIYDEMTYDCKESWSLPNKLVRRGRLGL